MARKDKKNGEPTTTIDEQGNPVQAGPIDLTDDDDNELPPEVAGDFEDEDDVFEFDDALFMKGVEVIDLAPDFIRPKGFLMVPRMNKRTGEISPQNATFAGVIVDIIPWKDARGKERVWYSCAATAKTGAQYIGRDQDDPKVTFTRAVEVGERIGISGSGAINALKTKKGHFVLLHWTGAKVPTKNGDMWEIKAKVSKDPVPAERIPDPS